MSSERERWEKLDLGQFDATDEEIRLADRFTAMSRIVVSRWKPMLVVSQQSWVVAGDDVGMPKEEAEWHCWMLAKALQKIAEG